VTFYATFRESLMTGKKLRGQEKGSAPTGEGGQQSRRGRKEYRGYDKCGAYHLT
jgi:hypothetical protein